MREKNHRPLAIHIIQQGVQTIVNLGVNHARDRPPSVNAGSQLPQHDDCRDVFWSGRLTIGHD